jgi:hypothetical protein
MEPAPASSAHELDDSLSREMAWTQDMPELQISRPGSAATFFREAPMPVNRAAAWLALITKIGTGALVYGLSVVLP